MEKSALGRGLSALIPEGHQEKEKIQTLPIEKLEASTFQPRQYFSDTRLNELAQSIKEKGIIQPILVRAKGDGFEIIAGERRFRAAKSLGHETVPAIVKSVSDEDVLELSIIENLQREELNRIEEAKAFKRLQEEFKMTHETIAKRVSKDRATITNTLRLLELPAKVQGFIEDGTITQGHAKALLSLENEKEQLRVSNLITKKSLSVRQTENLVRTRLAGKTTTRKTSKDIHLVSLEEKLQHRFGTRVKILQGKKRGKIVIEYFSKEDLDRVLGILDTQS